MTDTALRNLLAVLPALNEAKTIANVITPLLKYADVLVVDDGSIDETGALARTSGAIVVTHPLNRGYDQALRLVFFGQLIIIDTQLLLMRTVNILRHRQRVF